MTTDLNSAKQAYATLLIHTGVNLQPGQSLLISAELAHAEFVRMAVQAAYKAGARYVHVQWNDAPTAHALLEFGDVDAVEFPAYEVTRHRQMVDEGWARLAITGDEFPNLYDDIDPSAIRTWSIKRRRAIKFYQEAMMANRLQWCVAAVPTSAWAQRVFPELPAEPAIERLWREVLRLSMADGPDPIAAWNVLNQRLQTVSRYLMDNEVQAVHFLDPAEGPDGAPATDLVIGLADHARWVGGAACTPGGVVFQPNMPTEEVFCAPHRERTEGYVRTSRPCYPMEREVTGAYFRFENGRAVEFHAERGAEVLEQFLQVEDADRLGEVALVDSGSPVFESGLFFYETLFDENAACHIAFGQGYAECVENGAKLTQAELQAHGLNHADIHVDFMIGTATMNVSGICADGRRVPIMRAGKFVSELQA